MRAKFIIKIPCDLAFGDLKIRREMDGDLSFDRRPLLRILDASGIPRNFLELEENAATLINDWYMAHRLRGGMMDPIVEDVITEVVMETARGQNVSHQPGRA